MSSRTHVFATAELLELIFLFLDATTLFAIQRVCHEWLDLINDSRKLQEYMFLRAPSEPNYHPFATPDRIVSLYNNKECHADAGQSTTEVTLCPILDVATRFARTRANSIAASCNQSALHGSPSWHKMLLTSPPCKSATVALWWRIGESVRGSIYLESVTNPTGLRFADIVQAALAQRAGNWKAMPDGKFLPLSAVGDVTLEEFLKVKAGEEEVRMMEATSFLFLKMG